MRMKMLHPLLLLLMAFMAIVTLPVAQGQGSNLLFLGPGKSYGHSEVFLPIEKSGLRKATCIVPQYPTDVYGSVGFIYRDFLHICGGEGRSKERERESRSSSIQSGCFSLVSATWSATTPMLSPRASAAAVRMQDGSVLVSGGWDGSSYLQSSELLTGSTWSPAMQLPSPRYGHCMLQLSSGELFLHGGRTDSGSLSDTHISEDKLSWEEVKSSKAAREYHTCAEVTIDSNHQVWVGGVDRASSSEIFQFVEGTWTWTDGPDLPNYKYARDTYPGQLVSYIGKLFYAGGDKRIYQLKDGWTQKDASFLSKTSRLSVDAWTHIGDMLLTRYFFPALMITEDICQGEKPTIYDRKRTSSEYNPREDGSCAYVGGDLASTVADLLSKSNETHEVECCTSEGITNQTCGNGTSCSTICGPTTGCTTIKAFMETENSTVCSPSMDSENWCQEAGIIDDLVGKNCTNGGERKKRNANFGNTPIFRLSYCPYRVKTVQKVDTYPECCFHPTVRQNQAIKQKCCGKYNVCA